MENHVRVRAGLGVGLSKLDYLVKTTGNDQIRLMEDIKQDMPDSSIGMIPVGL